MKTSEIKMLEPQLVTYLHSKGAQLGLPVTGTFELTARCNFRCPMCYVHEDGNQSRELTAAQWIELARQAADRGMVFALLTGGEPFLRRDFFEIYDAMKSMGLFISINTNGSLLRGEIRRRLLENPPSRMNISLYGGCPETYRDMCGQDAFDQVVENIRALKEAGVGVSLNLSITPWNRQDIGRIYKIADELQVPVKASAYMYPPIRVNGGEYGCSRRLSAQEAAQAGFEWDRLRFTPEMFEERAARVRAMAALDPRECGADPERSMGCRAGRSTFWLTWEGKMLSCGMMPAPSAYPLEQGFDEAWAQIRRETEAVRTPVECTTCPRREMCSVCAAVCVTETGAPDRVPKYVCAMTQATAQAYENWRKDS